MEACNPSSSCCLWVLDHLCSNLSQSFHFCRITEIRSLSLCLFFPFSLLTLLFWWKWIFSFKTLFAIWLFSPQRFHYHVYLSVVSWQYQKCWTIPILVQCLLCVMPLVCSSYSSFATSSPFFNSSADDKKILSYLHIHLFSNVLHRRRRVSPKRPMYLLIVGSHYCIMCFAYMLHIRRQNPFLFPCLYIEHFKLVIEIIFHYCTTPPCHTINLFKRPFRGRCFERLDDSLVLLVSLIFLYPQRILISVRSPFSL